jgi:hypothetical protein
MSHSASVASLARRIQFPIEHDDCGVLQQTVEQQYDSLLCEERPRRAVARQDGAPGAARALPTRTRSTNTPNDELQCTPPLLAVTQQVHKKGAQTAALCRYSSAQAQRRDERPCRTRGKAPARRAGTVRIVEELGRDRAEAPCVFADGRAEGSVRTAASARCRKRTAGRWCSLH